MARVYFLRLKLDVEGFFTFSLSKEVSKMKLRLLKRLDFLPCRSEADAMTFARQLEHMRGAHFFARAKELVVARDIPGLVELLGGGSYPAAGALLELESQHLLILHELDGTAAPWPAMESLGGNWELVLAPRASWFASLRRATVGLPPDSALVVPSDDALDSAFVVPSGDP